MRPAEIGVAEVMIGVLAREIQDADVLGVGLGTQLGLIAAMAARRSHARGSEFTCGGALSPEVGILEAMRGPDAMASGTGAWISHFDTMQIAESQVFTMMFLRPAQVDSLARLNVSRVGGANLPGGVGTGDTPSLLPRVVCYHTDHRPRSLPERADFVTGLGAGTRAEGGNAAGVTTLVTNLCVITFGSGPPRVRSIHPGQSAESVQSATGFPLDGLAEAEVTKPPSAALLAAIEEVDPVRLRDLEFRGTRAAAEERLAAVLGSAIPVHST